MKKETALIVHDFVSKQIQIQKILDTFDLHEWNLDSYESPTVNLQRTNISIPDFANQTVLKAIYHSLFKINEWMLIEIENETYGKDNN